MLFVCLDIFTELEAAMSFEVQPLPCHNGAWAQFVPEVTLRWQTVQPKYTCLSHLCDQSCGNLAKWQSVVDRPHSFFDCSDESLNLPYVFLARCFVQRYTQACQFPTQVSKLAIHESHFNLEPPSLVNLQNTFQTLQ